jgi:hypothetical protein
LNKTVKNQKCKKAMETLTELHQKKFTFQYKEGQEKANANSPLINSIVVGITDPETGLIIFDEKGEQHYIDVFGDANSYDNYSENGYLPLHFLFANDNIKTKKVNVAKGYSILEFSEIHSGCVFKDVSEGLFCELSSIKTPTIQMNDDILCSYQYTESQIHYKSKRTGKVLAMRHTIGDYQKDENESKEQENNEEEFEMNDDENENKEEEAKTIDEKFKDDFSAFLDEGFNIYKAEDDEEYRLLFKEGADPILVEISEDETDTYTILDYVGDDENGVHFFQTEDGEEIKFNRK